MDRRRCGGLVALLVAALSGCAHPPPRAAAPQGPTPTERLAAAEALLREGCLDCLIDAYAAYTALRAIPAAADAAADGAIRSAALIAVRERQLGMIDEGYFDRAIAAAAENPARQAAFAQSLDLLAAVPSRGGARADPAAAQRSRTFVQNRADWSARLRAHADDDVLSGVAWIWFTCTYAQTRQERETTALLAPIAALHDAPVMAYQAATCAVGGDAQLKAIGEADPRFHEIDFWTGSQQIAARDLDAAQETFTRAYEWHREWPAAINSLANLYLTAEEFQPALDFYERSIALAPGVSDSLLGRVRALSYLGRYQEAVARATELLPVGPPGDAYYWRAWNQNQLGALDAAWDDVEAAERVWHNNEVLKLAGIVAYRRRELEVAGTKFEGALQIDAADCESRFDLAGVRVELTAWDPGAAEYARAAQCFENSRAALAAEIARLRASGGNPERVARQVARREQMRAAALRTQIQSWFNGAVANLQLGRKDEARTLAEKIQDDEQFGARAKEILARIH